MKMRRDGVWRLGLGVVAWLGAMAGTGAMTLPVVPAPREVQAVVAEVFAPPADRPVTWRGPVGATRADFAGPLQAELARWHGAAGAEVAGATAEAVVAFGLPATDPAFRARCERLGLRPDETLGREGYLLLIGAEGITAAANEEAGLFYAWQTLRQLLRARPPGAPLEAMRVRDWPAFPFRGVMDDISRGPLSNGDFLRAQIRRCAEMKLNRLTWYVEEVVRVPSHPGFAPAGAIPLEEFQALAAYAATFHVELMGSFQTLGHFDKILRVPAYAPLGATPDMLEPAVPATTRFLSEVVGDMLPAFSAPEFLLNGDEAFDLAEAARRRGLSAAALYAAHYAPLVAQVQRAGRTPVLWGDMMLEHRELLDLLPKGVAVATWNYDVGVDFDALIAPFRAKGFEVIVCPGVLNSYRISPDFGQAMGNIRGFVAAARRQGAQGVLTTVWDDGGMHLFARDWPGVAFGAEQAWNPEAGESFFARYEAGRGHRSPGATERFVQEWARLGRLGPTWLMNSEWRFVRVVPAAGEDLEVNVRDWARIGEIATRAEAALAAWGDDPEADAWRWTVAEVRWHADWRAALARWSATGGHAAPTELDGLIVRLERLRDELRRLWSAENRAHFTTEALTPDTRRLEELRAWRERLAKGGAEPGRVRTVDGSFLTYWLVSDALPRGENPLADMGGEARAKPKPGMRFLDAAGQYRSWSKTAAPTDTTLEWPGANDAEAVRYAYATLDTHAAREARLHVRATCGVRLWVNGGEVANPAPGAPWVLRLTPGRNAVLLQLAAPPSGAAWRLSAELPAEELRHRKHRYDFGGAGGTDEVM